MNLEGKHIFVVDDDVVNLAIITAILRRCGAKVYYDVWGANTLPQMKSLPQLDIVLLDLMLQRTKLSGYMLYDQMRGDPKLQKVPVILVTAADSDTELPVARQKGFNGYISKPIDRIAFGQQVADVIAGKEVWIT